MRKLKEGRKFSLKSDPRKALQKTWVNSLFTKERMQTIQAKAKEFRRFAEHYITIAKKGDLASYRQLSRFLPAKTVKKLIIEIAPRFKTRKGGYTRLINLGPRKSDGSKMVIIELTERVDKKKVVKKETKKKS
jgi:large subunit ribosomal protein L17